MNGEGQIDREERGERDKERRKKKVGICEMEKKEMELKE